MKSKTERRKKRSTKMNKRKIGRKVGGEERAEKYEED